MRVDGNAVLSRPQASRAEHRGLPEAAQRGHVHAARGVAHVVGQVDLRSLAEIGLRQGSRRPAGRRPGRGARGLSELPCAVRGS